MVTTSKYNHARFVSAHIGIEVEMKAIEARFQVGKWTPFSTEKGTGVNNHL